MKTLSSNIILTTEQFNLRKDRIIRPNGEEGIYYIVDRGPSVFIVPLTVTNEIYLIKQFRYPTQTWSWEIPAGGTDGEEPFVAARRELQEETGLIAYNWTKICEFPIAPGISSNIGHLFIARSLELTNENKQEEEGITEVQRFSFQELDNLITSFKIIDGPSLAAITLSKQYWQYKGQL